ncbi:MAG: zinc-binding alcohol dehydrogenase family protein [Pseudomonadota bacterium]|uniref:zinc-binding alcohol dehydrogenase family protein n=1 Tax=Gallaecimonas pentaromativorans TaxID=584787 RepID=UPI00067F4478|nr:zinc-binding alcohol dehydrogenase family protein [Gallaecimonas pentaromativorans]MED5525669.1 zinc-binding alcohol dehydrogenase family protein [Pseudomonadota bacterium]
MKAIAFTQSLPISDANALQEMELPMPTPGPHDIRVAVSAVSVNPVDVKVRAGAQPAPGEPRILGFDAVGVVDAIGSQVTRFKVGDRVWYAGDITRPGSNAEFQLVDERIAALAPQRLSDGEAAAMPLTAITAWELLFDRLELDKRETQGKTLLVVGAAGGVGSILVQLAKTLTGLTVIGTASRPQSQEWVLSLGADAVIDHRQPLDQALQAAGFEQVDYVVSLNQTDHHFDAIIEALKPQGKLALIDDPELIDVRKLKRKSLSLHWELMFTRPMFGTDDIERQHQLLTQVAAMVDKDQLKTTLAEVLGTISAANLKKAHALIESNATIGKLVLAGFTG